MLKDVRNAAQAANGVVRNFNSNKIFRVNGDTQFGIFHLDPRDGVNLILLSTGRERCDVEIETREQMFRLANTYVDKMREREQDKYCGEHFQHEGHWFGVAFNNECLLIVRGDSSVVCLALAHGGLTGFNLALRRGVLPEAKDGKLVSSIL